MPPIVRNVENTLANAIAQKDAKATYDALRVYLLLNLDEEHKDKFNTSEIEAWVVKDWEPNDSVAAFRGRASIYEHLGALFDGSRIVHSPYAKNDALIRSAREFLESSTSTERIYDRAKIAMTDEVLRILSSFMPSVLMLEQYWFEPVGEPLDRDIPGLFTVEGYQELFDKRITEFVAAAYANDEWVMGRETEAFQKKLLSTPNNGLHKRLEEMMIL